MSALQNLLFCIPKAAVLHGKSVGFAVQKSHFRNAKAKLPFSVEIIFTKSKLLLGSMLEFL
ncbi:hypothetical protein [Prevotella intermedia]|uniref:hypothetical protein n=1 Tax=Prevotella intermedia TaxID=28131 RepID=UPI0009B63893|nr:hypothetical protein [Prevotella intermedia]PDP67385.1 hypothetical protein CLI70_11425 [Prevotella intermedia]